MNGWLGDFPDPKPDPLISPETLEKLLKVYKEEARFAEEAFDALVSLRLQLDGDKFEGVSHILNALELLQLARFEIAVMLPDMLTSSSNLRRFLYSRLLLLSVYEASKSLRGVLGGQFQKALVEVGANPVQISAFRTTHSAVSKCYSACEPHVRDVRHGVAGHRASNPESRLRLLQHSHPQLVADYVIEFEKALKPGVQAESEMIPKVLAYIRKIS